MDRRDFVKTCSLCFGTGGFLSGCESTRYVSGVLEGDGIAVATTEFVAGEGSKVTLRPYVIVRNERLEYPICLYRFSESEYSALLMRCTHQGTELQVLGDHLHCPAHGSEFSSRGKVAQGPAENNLRIFPVRISPEKLLIELK